MELSTIIAPEYFIVVSRVATSKINQRYFRDFDLLVDKCQGASHFQCVGVFKVLPSGFWVLVVPHFSGVNWLQLYFLFPPINCCLLDFGNC